MKYLKSPLVSILINNYNYGQFLAEAIDSALMQTYTNIEVIVVDDGSTDNSHEIIKSYRDRITSILKKNGGQASAFNTGFAASNGEIVCFLDSDDIFLPDKVKEIVNIFTEHQDVEWCFHVLNFFGDNQHEFISNDNLWSSRKYDLRSTIKRGKLSGRMPEINLATSTMCFRSSLLKKILPMPEAIKITSDDYIKYTSLGLTPGYILIKELALQRIHDTNAYTLRKDRDKLKLIAKINVLSAYWMRTNFPAIMSRFYNIFALAISSYWLSGGVELESMQIIKSYLFSLTWKEKVEVYARFFYNYLKIRYAKS
jgi:glycosyltransferase involved in cell wall biosynthesis